MSIGGRFRLRVTPEQRRMAALAAAGRVPADLLITNCKLVNTLTAEIYHAHITVTAGLVSGVLPIDARLPPAAEVVDAGGRYAVPGLVDCHMHIESSMVLPPAFAAAIVPRGVLTIIADPHEIGNVMGLDGIRLLIDASRGLPLDVFFQAPSCVPATPLETAGAEIGPREIDELLGWEEVLALGEVMDYTAVVAEEGRTAAVLEEALRRDAVVEGHAPDLTGSHLAAYVAAGVTSDHTFVTPSLAVERLRVGVTLELQLKSLSEATLREAAARARSLNLCLVTDDVMPDDLVERGHVDFVLREAVRLGLDPVEAVRATTLAPARRMRLWDRGAIAPGQAAHIVLTWSLQDFAADMVFHAGRLVARGGSLTAPVPEFGTPDAARRTVKIPPPPAEAFLVAAAGRAAMVRVMGLRSTSTYTDAETARLPVVDGAVRWGDSDLCLAAVFERHGRAGTVGYGFLRGGLRRGAVATTWAHDSHNLLVIGRSPEEMAAAARWVVVRGGGMAAARGEEVLAGVHLPIAGIVSDRSAPEVAEEVSRFRLALQDLGFTHTSPIMALGVLALSVSPALKLTDRGLVDVGSARVVPLFVEEKM